MEIKPKRRFQFSLRTMFVVVTLISIPLAWVGYSLNWIWHRHAALQQPYTHSSIHKAAPIAPAGLWMFGEKGVGHVTSTPERMEELRKLFPEAVVTDDVHLNL